MIPHNICDHKNNIYSLKYFCIDDLRTSQRVNQVKVTKLIVLVLVMESFFKLNALRQLKKDEHCTSHLNFV